MGDKLGFDEMALVWDTEERIERAQSIANSMRPHLGLTDQSRVMEFGCGTGLVSFGLNQRVKELVMVDSSEGMIGVLNQKIAHYYSERGIEEADHYMVAVHSSSGANDGLIGPNEPEGLVGPFDVIHMTLVLHHIEDYGALLQKFYDQLQVGGRLAIVDLHEEDGSFHQHFKDARVHHGFDPGVLGAQLEQVGFRVDLTETIFNGVREKGSHTSDYALFLMIATK